MKKFELLDHTADIAGRVYGKDIEELFSNACELFNLLLSPDFVEDDSEIIEIRLDGDTEEELLVKFLNELIYRAEVKRRAGIVAELMIKNEEGMFRLHCKIEERGIQKRKREIKAATYHGLKIMKGENFFSTEVIFDV